MIGSAPYLRALEALFEHGYTEEDILDMPAAKAGEMIYELCDHANIDIQAFKDTRKKLYRERGYKVADRLRKAKEELGGELVCAVIGLGDVPLKSKDTIALARKIESLVVPKNSPGRAKIERGITRNSLVHLHLFYHKTDTCIPPTSVTVGDVEYQVNIEILGTSPYWDERYDYDEQIVRMTTYLYKPSNMSGTKYHNKLDLKHAAYLNWFLEERDLFKLSRSEHKKIRNGVRLSWNFHINTRKLLIKEPRKRGRPKGSKNKC